MYDQAVAFALIDAGLAHARRIVFSPLASLAYCNSQNTWSTCGA